MVKKKGVFSCYDGATRLDEYSLCVCICVSVWKQRDVGGAR